MFGERKSRHAIGFSALFVFSLYRCFYVLILFYKSFCLFSADQCFTSYTRTYLRRTCGLTNFSPR